MAGLGLKLDFSYVVSINIAAKFKDMNCGIWQNVGLACLVCENIIALAKSSDVRWFL